VQVDEEERVDEPVPERVDEPARLKRPHGPRQPRVEASDVCKAAHERVENTALSSLLHAYRQNWFETPVTGARIAALKPS
jgi:hypothetical protein